MGQQNTSYRLNGLAKHNFKMEPGKGLRLEFIKDESI